MKDKTCVFIGHSKCFGVNEEFLEAEIKKLIEYGVTDYLFGGMGGFDWLCAGTVRKLKGIYPDIKCILVIPYLTVNLKQKEKYYDEILYPDYKSRHYKAQIVERNRYMVDHSSYAICYITYTWGGAVKTFAYAKMRNVKIVNIADLS